MERSRPTVTTPQTAAHSPSIRVFILGPNNLGKAEHATPTKKLRVRRILTDTFAGLCHNVVKHMQARGDQTFSVGGIFHENGKEFFLSDPIDLLQEGDIVHIVQAPTADNTPRQRSAATLGRQTSIALPTASGQSALPSRTAMASPAVPDFLVAVPDLQAPSQVRLVPPLARFAQMDTWANSLIA